MVLPPLVEPGPPLTGAQATRFSRHILLPEIGELGQRRLLNARVCVVGAGGLGSPVLLYLAAAGVGMLGVVDDDVVEPSNLQRQIVHGQRDIGRSKADSAASAVKRLSPDASVQLHLLRLDSENVRDVFADYDLVIDGSDNFATRYLVADACAELGLPLVWAAILRFDAQLTVFWERPPGSAAGVGLRDLFPEQPESEGDTCSSAGVLGALCGQVGSTMAAEAVKLIVGAGETLLGRVLVLDALTARWSELPLQRRRAAAPPAPTSPDSSVTNVELKAAEVDVSDGRTDAVGGAAADASRGGPAGAPDRIAAHATGLPQRVTADELTTLLAGRERGEAEFVLVDVRETFERVVGAIPGSVHVPLAELMTETGRSRLGATESVVVYCHIGPRAQVAARELLAHGFPRVAVLEGGMAGWPPR